MLKFLDNSPDGGYFTTEELLRAAGTGARLLQTYRYELQPYRLLVGSSLVYGNRKSIAKLAATLEKY